MRVFISWSGGRSQAVAQALRDWLPLVLHFAEPWLSEADIAAGERWAQSVAKELEASNFGIVCVTRENVTAPWILFEAGSLAKSLDGSKVIPLLLDLEFSEIGGPLAQFQAKKADREGLREVIESINRAAAGPIPEARANQLFEALWPQLETQLGSIPKLAATAKPIRPQHEILEELVASIRAIDSRLRTIEENAGAETPRLGRMRRGRATMMMMHELPHVIGDHPGDPTGLLVVAGIVREEAPWLYELAVEAYRVAKSGKPEQTRAAMKRLRRAVDFTLRGPISPEEFGFDARALHSVVRELEHYIVEVEAEEPDVAAKPPRKKAREQP